MDHSYNLKRTLDKVESCSWVMMDSFPHILPILLGQFSCHLLSLLLQMSVNTDSPQKNENLTQENSRLSCFESLIQKQTLSTIVSTTSSEITRSDSVKIASTISFNYKFSYEQVSKVKYTIAIKRETHLKIFPNKLLLWMLSF